MPIQSFVTVAALQTAVEGEHGRVTLGPQPGTVLRKESPSIRRRRNETIHPAGRERWGGPGAFCLERHRSPPGPKGPQVDHLSEGAPITPSSFRPTIPAGNQVVAYDRADNGGLTLANTYNTGGLGGVLNGSAVDHLASQGSLTYAQRNGLLYAVNAGSNTVSVFSVRATSCP